MLSVGSGMAPSSLIRRLRQWCWVHRLFGDLAPLTGERARRKAGAHQTTRPFKEYVMAVHNPLAGVPLRAARWSATHPWRAILAWFVFVLVAVGLAVAIPTQQTTDADYRLGESGRADAMVSAADLDHPDTENVLITSRAGAPRWTSRRRSRPPPSMAADLRDVPGVDRRVRSAMEPGPVGAAARGPAGRGPGRRRAPCRR